ncbi:hypothetical protein DBV15_07843 [Temnothorax longispinosus]|uniref:Uncharacterized protein n=1 Tax=Temnothorax longispinosus TaxID=300112 RepID=A0A4S2KR83_9HYME|nr:hypothetical protein DBV15_07843 [Temnothorax longispinosus]
MRNEPSIISEDPAGFARECRCQREREALDRNSASVQRLLLVEGRDRCASKEDQSMKTNERFRRSNIAALREQTSTKTDRPYDNEFNERIMQDLTLQEKYLIFLSSESQPSNYSTSGLWSLAHRIRANYTRKSLFPTIVVFQALDRPDTSGSSVNSLNSPDYVNEFTVVGTCHTTPYVFDDRCLPVTHTQESGNAFARTTNRCLMTLAKKTDELEGPLALANESLVEGGQQGIKMNFGAELADSNLTLIYANAAGCKFTRKFIPDWSREDDCPLFSPTLVQDVTYKLLNRNK